MANPHRRKRQLELINQMYPNGTTDLMNELIQEAEAARQDAEAAKQKAEKELKEHSKHVISALAVLAIVGAIGAIALGIAYKD